jgi:plastocyanin
MSVRVLTNLSLAGCFALFLGACSNNSTPAPAPSPNPPAGGSSVTIVNGARVLTTTAFSPNPLNISKGTTVTWTNSDSTTHTATSAGTFDTGNIAAGTKSNAITFSTAGTVQYHCSIHPTMVGTINVQ